MTLKHNSQIYLVSERRHALYLKAHMYRWTHKSSSTVCSTSPRNRVGAPARHNHGCQNQNRRHSLSTSATFKHPGHPLQLLLLIFYCPQYKPSHFVRPRPNRLQVPARPRRSSRPQNRHSHYPSRLSGRFQGKVSRLRHSFPMFRKSRSAFRIRILRRLCRSSFSGRPCRSILHLSAGRSRCPFRRRVRGHRGRFWGRNRSSRCCISDGRALPARARIQNLHGPAGIPVNSYAFALQPVG